MLPTPPKRNRSFWKDLRLKTNKTFAGLGGRTLLLGVLLFLVGLLPGLFIGDLLTDLGLDDHPQESTNQPVTMAIQPLPTPPDLATSMTSTTKWATKSVAQSPEEAIPFVPVAPESTPTHPSTLSTNIPIPQSDQTSPNTTVPVEEPAQKEEISGSEKTVAKPDTPTTTPIPTEIKTPQTDSHPLPPPKASRPAQPSKPEPPPSAENSSGLLYEEHFSASPDQEEEADSSPTTGDSFDHKDKRISQFKPNKGPIPIVIVIDDLGYNGPISKGITELPVQITLAVLPAGQFSRQITKLGISLGKEVILHQPMEPVGYPKITPGPQALLNNMSSEQREDVLRKNLAQFPEVVGLNNHMGSRLTNNVEAMDQVMVTLKKKGLYFIDSRTIPKSVAFNRALSAGIPAYHRDVFIDNVHQEGAILRQLQTLETYARKHNGALGIGHPYPETLNALRHWLPGLKERGFVIQPASVFLSANGKRTKATPPKKQPAQVAPSLPLGAVPPSKNLKPSPPPNDLPHTPEGIPTLPSTGTDG
ncbi:MAG: divergent polysaccharide deacetylase family protein [Magnetococcus sp. DMHC-6]